MPRYAACVPPATSNLPWEAQGLGERWIATVSGQPAWPAPRLGPSAPAPGTARFGVPIAEGWRPLAELRGRVTGLAWPTYVFDIPGGYGKVPIGPGYLDADNHLRDPWGGRHADPQKSGG